MTTFEILKQYINKKPIGSIILRKELQKDLIHICEFSRSIDQYRLQLTHLGFLKSIKRGQYRKEKDIPEKFNTANLSRAYKNKKVKL